MFDPLKTIFRLNLTIMRICGIYPSINHKFPAKFHSYLMYFLFVVPVPALAMVFFICFATFDEIIDNAYLIIQIGSFIIKLPPFIYNRDKMREMVHSTKNPIFINFRKNQKWIMEDCEAVCKWWTKFFLGCCWMSWLLFFLVPVAKREMVLPTSVWLPYNHKANRTVYILTYAFVSIGVLNAATSNGVADPLISGLAYYATSQIKLLKDNLQNLDLYAKEIALKNAPEEISETKLHDLISEQIYKEIKQCVIHHKAIILFCKKYDDCFTLPVFTQFCASVLVICICCLQMVMLNPVSLSFCFVIIYLTTMLSEIYLYSYFGTLLYEESNSLIYAIYMGNWYEYDVKCQKALIMLMESSKRPVVIRAGKILDLSLGTFTSILKRAYSLLAILKNY